MAQVGEDMQNAIPTDFNAPSVSINSAVNGATVGGFGGSLMSIHQMIVRAEDDIRRISQEL